MTGRLDPRSSAAARRLAVALAAALLGLSRLAATGAQAARAPVVHLSASSSQHSSHSASVSAKLSVAKAAAAKPASAGPAGAQSASSAAQAAPPPPPTLAADSPLLAEPAPAGPGSYWYPGPSGEQCIYAPSASPACFAIVAAAAPALDVPATAASLAAQLSLSLAPIDASPAAARDGLTGAASWFWLETAPAAEQLSLSLDGETVSVTAQPGAVSWSFGDGASLEGGPGVAFADGPAPPGAVTHIYETRCLPGDRGSDPYVLPGCGAQGYPVAAEVSWAISYSAQGPLDSSGELASRTTSVTLSYPVSEVRAFLESGGA